MAIVVVGGGGRGAGKTALVCGVIFALPEWKWVGVKIASHPHEYAQQLWEETAAGSEKDTGRYLTAGARQAFLLTAGQDEDMSAALFELGKKVAGGANIIFESNRVVNFVNPDACLVLSGDPETKATFGTVLRRANAIVLGPESPEPRGPLIVETWPVFRLERYDRLTPELADWIRNRLIYR